MDPDKPIFVMPDLKGPQGNALYLVGAADRALKEHGASAELREGFREEALSGDYQHVLNTIMLYCNVLEPITEYRMLGSLEGLGYEDEDDE